MSEPRDYEVIVVGAGPTGAVLAALLGLAGRRTLVLERDREVYPLPRAVVMDHEIMRVMQEVGIGQRIPAFAGAVEDYLFQNAAGENIVEIRGGGALGVSGYPASTMFVQPELEACLRERLLELPSVTARFGTAMQGFEVEPDGCGVRVEFETEGARASARAQFLVACDGASSSIRSRLALPLEDLGFDEPWVVVDTLVRGETGLPADTAYQFCDPQRPTTCIPAGPGRRRWEFMLLPGETRESMQRPENIWPLLAPWGGRDSLELVRIAVYRFHAVIATLWRAGPVLLAGDAAHQTPPFMGQGLCSGVRDAANLAWKLDRVLAGQSSWALLDSYQAERAPHVRHVVETSVEMGRLVCELDLERAAERDRRCLAAKAAGKAGPGGQRGGQVAPLIDGLIRQGDPGAGWLFPQPDGRRAERIGRMDALVGCGFRLVVDDPQLVPDRAIMESTGSVPVVLGSVGADGFVRTGGPDVAAWLQGHGVHAALVRPDHYVYGTAVDKAGVQLLLDNFQRALAG